jgi:hypothetical protein
MTYNYSYFGILKRSFFNGIVAFEDYSYLKFLSLILDQILERIYIYFILAFHPLEASISHSICTRGRDLPFVLSARNRHQITLATQSLVYVLQLLY